MPLFFPVLQPVRGHLHIDMPANWDALTNEASRFEQTVLTDQGHSSIYRLQLLKPVRRGYQVRFHTLATLPDTGSQTELHVARTRIGLLTIDPGASILS